MKNFLLSPASNAVMLGVALILTVLLAVRSAAPADITGLSLNGSNTSNFGNVVADSVSATTITATNLVSQVVGTNAAYITATTAMSAAALTVPGAVTLSGNVASTGNVSAYAVTGTASISTPLLYVEGIAQSGPVRFGTASGVTTGTLIAHGLGTTPTAVILTVDSPINAFTNTIGVGPTNATSFTVYVPGGATVNLDWMAGR